MHIRTLTHLHTHMHIWPRFTDELNHHMTLPKLDGGNKLVFINLIKMTSFETQLMLCILKKGFWSPTYGTVREVTDLTLLL